MVYSTRRFVLCLTLCHFVLVFFCPFSNAITSLGEERANLSAFRTFVRFVLVWICRFPLPLGVWERLRFVIVALPGLFAYIFFSHALCFVFVLLFFCFLLLLFFWGFFSVLLALRLPRSGKRKLRCLRMSYSSKTDLSAMTHHYPVLDKY